MTSGGARSPGPPPRPPPTGRPELVATDDEADRPASVAVPEVVAVVEEADRPEVVTADEEVGRPRFLRIVPWDVS